MKAGVISGIAMACLAGSAAAQSAPPLSPADPTQALPQAAPPDAPLDSSALQPAPVTPAGRTAAPSFVLQDVQFEGAAALPPEALAPA